MFPVEYFIGVFVKSDEIIFSVVSQIILCSGYRIQHFTLVERVCHVGATLK